MKQEVKEQVKSRDDYQCYFCEEDQNLHVHHIVPRSVGGEDKLCNLKTVCASCHQKSEKLHSDALKRLKKEHQDEVEKLQEKSVFNLDVVKNSLDEVGNDNVELTVYIILTYPILSGRLEFQYVGFSKDKALDVLEEYESATMKKSYSIISLKDIVDNNEERFEDILDKM